MLAAAVRWGFGLQSIITIDHFDVMAKVMLAASIIMGLSYATEYFAAWYGGETQDRSLLAFMFTGTYAPMMWALIACNVVIPQAFWFNTVRRRIPAVFVVAIIINIGMWLERILIVWNTLSHGFLPSQRRVFFPTVWDWTLLFGSLGFFALMFLIFCRAVPAVSIHETKKLVHEEKSA